ncbi:O-glucosyltransferase rumi [Drosophila biarmipes]|uniref:O-glucosyltransferase rumi n=1 Tax=Drosophila biarmipes TaxID=125945 RepID=UPI001CDADCDD|nr:O-glucosyltransferase rumi [Drosophila biarmipes]
MTLPRRYLLVGALLLICASDASVSQEKCTAIAQYSNYNISYNFVPRMIKALAVYQPCEAEDLRCLYHAQTMTKNLEPYVSRGITPQMMTQSKWLGTLYQIVRGRIYRQENCSNPKRCADVDDLLLDIEGDLPDLEMVVNVCDWPQVHFLSGLSGPVFSYSTTVSHLYIMYPAWSFWTTAGPILQHYARAEKIPWDAKQIKAFFRGSRSSPKCDNLGRLSLRCPELVDDQYTAGHPMEADPAEEVSLVEHCQYKSLPWVHYVPVASDAYVEQLAGLMLFLREHGDLAEEIPDRGHQFVWLHLRMEDVQCHWRRLLQEYAKSLTYKVHIEPGFLQVSNKRALQLYRGLNI